MNFKPFLLIAITSAVFSNQCRSQSSYAKVQVNRSLQDTFSFTKNWDYDWTVIKDESKGKFEKIGGMLNASDTIHQYFSADCWTDLQGGYQIRYCRAFKSDSGMRLILVDGLPAYASNFSINVMNDSFSFQPTIISPAPRHKGENSVDIVSQSLQLNDNYSKGDVLIAFVNIVFTENSLSKSGALIKRNFTFKGYIRTIVE